MAERSPWATLRLAALFGLVPFGMTACGKTGESSAKAPVEPLREAIPKPDVAIGDRWEYETTGGEPASRWSIEVQEVLSDGHFRARVRSSSPFAGAPATEQLVEYDGPWNVLQPVPSQSLAYLQFPLRDGARWTSVAVGPGEMTRTLAQQVKGRQSITAAGVSVECVRVEGTETTTSSGPAPVAIPVQMTLWYCPTLRAAGRVETVIPSGPRITQNLIAYQPGR